MSASGPSILVVDDSEGVRAAVSMLLEEQGIDAVTASNPAEALSAILQAEYDLILIDVHLGTESGIALAMNVREQRPNSKIILMSGSGVNLEPHTGLPMLLKPFAREELLDCIRKVLDRAA
jgi:DNA-binding response OmpR family regulator